MENQRLIYELENGRSLDVLFISEEKYSMNLNGLSRLYKNLNIRVVKKSDNYNNILDEMDNIDIIIQYHEKKEDVTSLEKLSKLAYNYSNNNHIVTIGYSYINNYNDELENIVVIKCREKTQSINEFQIDNDYTPYDLLQLTINYHDYKEKEKVLKRSFK